MARPTKNNAEYFSHDADMRNDVKVKALRRNFSHKGYAVWCFILETLTDTDFFELDFDEVNKELLAADFDITVDELDEIVNYCLKINLLQMTDENRLFSAAHQRRFSGLITKRERDRERISRLMAKKNGSEKDVITAENGKSGCYRGDNTDSKVKESKIEESKEKESKGKKNRIYPYQGIADLWNEVCVSLPRLKTLSDNRRKKIKCRLDEFKAETEEQMLEAARSLFERVQASDFLTGRQPNKTGWTATFDWLFDNGSNWVKVQEGNYDNDRGARGHQSGSQAAGIQLGVGEYYDGTGRRTYGTGKATIPPTAPPRPSDRHAWDSQTKSWVLL